MKLRQEDFFISSEFFMCCEAEANNSTNKQLAGKRSRDDVVCEVLLPYHFDPDSAFAFLG